MQNADLWSSYLASAVKQFNYYQRLGRMTMEQIDEQSLFFEPSEGSNSIAIIVKHLHGNMISRWTDFLISDGEKEWRNRDQEFEGTLKDRKEVYRLWNEGWEKLFSSIESLKPEQLFQSVYIRGEEHSVLEAINRQLCHYSYHVGQIVLLGKIVTGSNWICLTIPRGKSNDFNKKKFGGTAVDGFSHDIENE